MIVYKIIPYAFSSFALIFSLFIYFKHDKKLKKQSALINNLQLTKLKKEAETEKKSND